jgi:hypothetical protein
MSNPDCPGVDGFACIGGWLYTQMSNALMIFPTNRKCPLCHPEVKGQSIHASLDNNDLPLSEYERTG